MNSSPFSDGLAKLRSVAEREEPRRDRPSTLALDAIRTAPEVFQPRTFEEDTDKDEAHVAELVRALNAKPEERRQLDPILVTAIGQEFYVVDGHHRLWAYRAVGVTRTVPVEYFEGTVQEAVKEAIHRNAKDRLAMSHEDKLEAAWRMVGLGVEVYSKSEVAEATGTADSTVGKMRAMLRELQAAGRYEPDMTWAAARIALKGEVRAEFDEAARRARVVDWAKRIRRTLGPRAAKHADVLAEALELYHRKMPERLVSAWPEEALKVAEQWNEAEF
jgi:hypothetical protein